MEPLGRSRRALCNGRVLKCCEGPQGERLVRCQAVKLAQLVAQRVVALVNALNR